MLTEEAKKNSKFVEDPETNLPLQKGFSTHFVKGLSDFWVILTEQILVVRRYLVYFFFLHTVGPLALVYAMGHYVGFRPDNTQLIKIIAGTITFALVTAGFTSIAQRLNVMRYQGSLLYYCSLPINKASFVSALLLSRLILLIPSVTMPIIGGMLMYNLKLHLDVWLVLIMLLGSFSLVALGTILGLLVKSYEVITLLSNAFIIVMAMASPNFIPAHLLPLPLQLLGWLLPSTYTSDIISLCLAGTYNWAFFFDLSVLLGIAIIGLVLITKFLKWRAD